MHRVLRLADNRSQLEPMLASMRQLAQQVQQSGEAPKQQFQSLESKVSVLEGSILSAGACLSCSSFSPAKPLKYWQMSSAVGGNFTGILIILACFLQHKAHGDSVAQAVECKPLPR